MIRDAEEHRGDDERKKALADVKNHADGLIYTTEKSLEEYASMLSEQDREEIQADLAALQELLKGEDVEAIQAAVAQLEGSAYRIAEAIYNQSAG